MNIYMEEGLSKWRLFLFNNSNEATNSPVLIVILKDGGQPFSFVLMENVQREIEKHRVAEPTRDLSQWRETNYFFDPALIVLSVSKMVFVSSKDSSAAYYTTAKVQDFQNM